jgi:subtilisin family serine protease
LAATSSLRRPEGALGLGFIDRKGLRDCRDGDFEGHGTWVASRIAGAQNGFASNGVAPGVRIGSYKVLAAGLGGLSSWILSGLVAACSDPRIDIVNMSIEGYVDPSDEASARTSCSSPTRSTTAAPTACRFSRPPATSTCGSTA